MAVKAAFCGTFDPVTNGHLALIERAAAQFDFLTVVVSPNSSKQCLLSADERRTLLEQSVAHLPNVSVMQFEGLATEAARKAGASVLVRGLRGAVDAGYEYNMAQMNRRIAPEIETVLLFSDPETALISSSNVRELLRYHLPVDDLVPLPVNTWLQEQSLAADTDTHQESAAGNHLQSKEEGK